MSFLMWPSQMWTLATHKHTKTHTHKGTEMQPDDD